MITRIAPTPSGYIHTGNIFNFLLNWLWARSNDGKVVLRIDDGDAERKRKEYVEDIFRVLEWLGLDWDIGPSGPGDFETNWSQQKRMDLYNSILSGLAENNLVFGCSCSRNQICTCQQKNKPLTDRNIAWKLKVEETRVIMFHDKVLGDTAIGIQPFVIRKKDGFAAYQLCSLADDRHFAVTHICRGNDLKESTAMQLYIDSKLPHPYFNNCSFWHHPLINNINGDKLSKSAGKTAQSIITTTNKEDVLALFATWLGWQRTKFSSPHDMLNMPIFKYSL